MYDTHWLTLAPDVQEGYYDSDLARFWKAVPEFNCPEWATTQEMGYDMNMFVSGEHKTNQFAEVYNKVAGPGGASACFAIVTQFSLYHFEMKDPWFKERTVFT